MLVATPGVPATVVYGLYRGLPSYRGLRTLLWFTVGVVFRVGGLGIVGGCCVG